MTETSPGVTVDPYENMREGTVGCIVPNTELRVLDLDTGESLPPNRDGEVCVCVCARVRAFCAENVWDSALTTDSCGTRTRAPAPPPAQSTSCP